MKLEQIGAITIESPNLNLGSSLRQHVDRGIERAISRSFNTLISAHITIKEDGGLFVTTVSLKVEDHHFDVVADAKGIDCYKSFNMAMTKIDAQLRRIKGILHSSKGKRRVDKDAMLSPRMTQRWEEPENDLYA